MESYDFSCHFPVRRAMLEESVSPNFGREVCWKTTQESGDAVPGKVWYNWFVINGFHPHQQ
jgi:hypothetical protein